MKKGSILFVVILGVVFFCHSIFANGLYLNSLGSRAMSMGGAFVGLADDFSAGFWNPAAVSQFDTISSGLYGAYYMPSSSYDYETAGVSTEFAKSYFGGMGSIFFPVNDRMHLGFSLYNLSRFQVEWSGAEIDDITGDSERRDWSTKVWVVTFAPSISYKMSRKFSLGLALNLNYGSYDLFMYRGIVYVTTDIGTNPIDVGAYSDTGNGVGFGATFGLFYRASEKFSLGASIRTPSKITFKGRSSCSNWMNLDYATDSNKSITFPLWIAGGIAVKPTQAFTVTADVQFSMWSTLETIKTDYASQVWEVVFEQSNTDYIPMYWKDTIQVRFGLEYLIDKIALRAGFYTDPSPVPDTTMNFHFPIVDTNWVTVGFGYDGRGTSPKGFLFDVGLEYGMGKDRTVDSSLMDTNPEYTAMPGTYKMDMLSFSLSFRYRF